MAKILVRILTGIYLMERLAVLVVTSNMWKTHQEEEETTEGGREIMGMIKKSGKIDQPVLEQLKLRKSFTPVIHGLKGDKDVQVIVNLIEIKLKRVDESREYQFQF